MNYILLLILLSTGHTRATDKDAQKFFDAYNNEYFEGKLSKTQVRFVHNLHDDKNVRLMGLTQFGTPNLMYLDDAFAEDKAVWGETILHEDCHIALNDKKIVEFDSHGTRWERCMQRLAEANAFHGLW